MKFRTDFVTNSSSASFILFVESTAANKQEFEESLKKLFAEYSRDFQKEESLPKSEQIKHIFGSLYAINDMTIMFNDYDDVPHYMRYMLLRHHIDDDLLKFGIKSLKLEIDRNHI